MNQLKLNSNMQGGYNEIYFGSAVWNKRVIVAYRKETRKLLFEQITKLKGFGVEVEFSAKALDGAITVKQVAVSADDKKGILNRLNTVAPLLRDARILWVGDNHASARNERALLEGLGARGTAVTTSEEAEKKLRENIYFLGLSDLNRGGKDTEGLEFVNRTVRSGTYRMDHRVRWDRPVGASLQLDTCLPSLIGLTTSCIGICERL
jgi:CheY-like chemotaxis protein